MRKSTKKIEVEIIKIDEKEVEALENFKKNADKALSIINENHFHLRLWEAIGGKK